MYTGGPDMTGQQGFSQDLKTACLEAQKLSTHKFYSLIGAAVSQAFSLASRQFEHRETSSKDRSVRETFP